MYVEMLVLNFNRLNIVKDDGHNLSFDEPEVQKFILILLTWLFHKNIKINFIIPSFL